MRTELWIIFITAGLIYNAYHDNFIGKMLKTNMRYIKIGSIGLAGFILYLFFKKHPGESKTMLQHASQLIKYMPIDTNSKQLVAPIIDLTHKASIYQDIHDGNGLQGMETPQMRRMMHSGGVKEPGKILKRSVSNTKKKYVASNQGWKCGHCQQQLDMAYEVDHIVELQHGGSNEVTNLVALCRNCHGKKTMMNRM